MALDKKTWLSTIKELISGISEHNLFLLSSSISYYSALALAPFVLILLGVASLLGQNLQDKIIEQVRLTFTPEVGKTIALIFANVNEGVNIGSISGFIGLLVLISTSSLVFLQLRYSLDVIQGEYNPHLKRSNWDIIKERIFSMVVVIATAILFLVSLTLKTVSEYFLKSFPEEAVVVINFSLYLLMFIGIHYFSPSKRPKFIDSFKTALLSSIFFIIGNGLIGLYLKQVAADSIYGAAGTLLVFLVWAYYSAFTFFLSAEVFLYLKKMGKIK